MTAYGGDTPSGFSGNKKSKWKRPQEPMGKEVTVTLGRTWLFSDVECGGPFMGLSRVIATQKAEGIQLHGDPLT